METAARTIGRYRIEQWLASGAMGEVYRAHDPVLDRPVAIKTIRRELIGGTGSGQWLERFKREARAAGQRFHPNIVAMLDYGEEDGAPFLAMEYVDGPSLANLLKSSGPLPPERAAAIMTQVLNGLAFAHEHGIIHRDIKPSNIIVPPKGPVKIADFGIARTDASDLTVAGDVLGTPAYVAPEQLRGDPVDNRSDLFAASVMFFEMLTGVKPFRAGTLIDSMKLMQTRGPEDVCRLNPLVPEALKPVLDRALAFEPERRYASAAELSQAIAAAMPADPAPARAAAAPPIPSLPPRPPAAAEPSWGAEVLQHVERELTTFIGPLASIAVKHSSRGTRDLTALYEQLSRYIENEKERRQFLEQGRRLAMSVSVPRRPAGSLGSGSTGEATALGPANASLPSPDVLAALETSLTRIIGPIAPILIRRQLRNFESLPQLYRALAADIPSDRDRAAFLDSMRAG